MSTTTAITACQEWYMKSAHYFYNRFLHPKSNGEDNIRSERILTLLLFILISIMAFFEVAIIILYLSLGENYKGVPVIVFTLMFFLFIGLYLIVRKGYYRTTGYIFTILLFGCVFYASYKWGASLPMGLLAYGLIVTMSSIIISSRFGFLMALFACAVIIGTGLHEHFINQIPEWKRNAIEIRDIFGYGIMIGLTALLSRISNREMEKSLGRARASELALKQERDNLEVIVEERTKALRESERERMRELYRFAEFGKLSGGIFHDLLNPLTAVSLSVSNLSKGGSVSADNLEAVQSLQTAVQATKRMEQFMATVRKQIKSEEVRGTFSLNEEIEDAIDLIRFKAEKLKVSIEFGASENITYFGNPLKFNQVITNLLINGIDSYAAQENSLGTRNVSITLSKKENIECAVTDHGKGITPEVLSKIFTPFFTTKEKGIGLGLSTTKDIIEGHFNGHIVCTSELGRGTTFTVSLIPYSPLPQYEQKTEKQNTVEH